MFPAQSMCAWIRRGTSRQMWYAHTVPNRPIGTDTKKMRRHWIGANTPPRTRPMKDPLMPATWLIPRAIPRSFSGKASVRIAAELAINIAAPTPWNTRITTSQIAAAAPDIHVTVSKSEKNV